MSESLASCLVGNKPGQRQIDIHYDMEMMAKNTADLVDCQKQLIRVQAEVAVANLRGMKELHSRQEETNALLGSVCHGIDMLYWSSQEAIDQMIYQTCVLEEGLQRIADVLWENQHALVQIVATLAQPYGTRVTELLNMAEDARQKGTSSSVKEERGFHFANVLRRLEDALAEPGGSQNYTVWFRIGWVKWKALGNIHEARDAFSKAMYLSESRVEHLDSRRHLAYMQYSAKDYQSAWSTIQGAIKHGPEDHDTLYDAARYASKVGENRAAVELLNKCIDLRPQTIVVMFSERDFF